MCDYVHFVEVDFIPGVYHFDAFDTSPPRPMFGGLAPAIMRIAFHFQSQKGLFESVFPISSHFHPTPSLATRLLRKGKSLARLLNPRR
jgi:hypothetical protein